ncbi:CASTOR/POLLUX-related putative ion channel [Brachyspira sp. SAP_772]|uniref:CASTOR/POLLUX-related putative ion channel n=1 Tax=Brachyspira sp. SAP_772 TaxID=2608385 RepID=UPI0012F500BE|nr:hypothetical protein [Brachyspira sp. SAP_772]
MKRILKYIRYNIDLIFSKGILYQLMVLVSIIVTTLLFVAIFMKIAFKYPIVDGFWDSLMQFIDTGNISAAEESNGFNAIVATFLAVTFIGVCGWGLLIAMINNALQERIRNLSNGNSFIMERNHSIVLGYGEEVFTIIEEFIMGRSKKIVVLSNYEASYIKKRISFFKKYKNTKVVIRKGNPSRFENLQLLNIERANSVSIVNEDDSESLKILLSLKRILQKENKNIFNKKRHRTLNICMLVNKKDNIEIVKSIDDSELFNVHIIYKYEILYKLIGQSIMYTGLSNIYEELFDYKGIDIEIESKHHCNALNFKNAASKYLKNNKILLGIINQEDKTLLIPKETEKIKTSDKLVVLFRRDDEKKEISISNHINNAHSIIKHRILLILESNKEKEVIEEIAEYIEKDNIFILHYEEIEKQEIKKDFLISKINKNKITKIILISENIDTDTKAMNILLVIRAIIKDYKYDIPILSLINSIENRDLIYSDDIKDFIVSGKLIGTLMATASKDSDLLYVFGDLLTKGGNDIVMVPYNQLHIDKKENKFIDIYKKLIEKRKIAIGIKERSKIILNPDEEIKIDEGSEIIVILQNI